jgi:hypothetical protein
MAFATACSTSYKVLSVEDHPNGEVTLLKTLTTTNMAAGFYNTVQYNYWECQRSAQGLNCEKTCWNRGIAGKLPKNAPETGAMCIGSVNPVQ